MPLMTIENGKAENPNIYTTFRFKDFGKRLFWQCVRDPGALNRNSKLRQPPNKPVPFYFAE